MQKALRFSLPVFISVLLLGASAPLALAATLNVSSDSTNAAYYDAVVKAADRLVTLQNANGSWDWAVTNATGPTGTTYLNIAGVTAEGLLSAYAVTGKQAYLDAAKKSGDFIISGINASTPKSINSYNVLFLQKLSTALNDTTYSTKAAEYFGMLYSATPTTICATGCADSAGIIAGQKAKRGATETPDGIVLWDLVPYVEYATLVSDPVHAAEIGAAIVAMATDTAYVNTISNYDLGLVSALKTASLINDATNKTTISSLLVADTDGSFGKTAEGKVQVTSYALRALKLVSDTRAVASASYIVNGVIPTGGWVDTDGSEYAEADSEAVTALVGQLPQGIQYYSIQDAINAAAPGDTIDVAAGTYTENGQIVIDKDLTIVGEDKATTIIKPSTDTATGGFYTDGDAWIVVSAGKTFNLSKVTLDGTGKLIGTAIMSRGLGTITDNNITNIKYNETGPDYGGVGIAALDGADVTISNNSLSEIGRDGIFVARSSNANITGNTYTGKGPGTWLDFGIGVGENSTAIISGNNISNANAASSPASTYSYGIAIYGADDGSGVHNTRADITGNTITNNGIGIALGYPGLLVSGSTISGNNVITGNTYGVYLYMAKDSIITGNTITGNNTGIFLDTDAETGNTISGNSVTGSATLAVNNLSANSLAAMNNWWGDAAGAGVAVSGNVLSAPWCLDSNCTFHSDNQPPTFSGSPETSANTDASYVYNITTADNEDNARTITALTKPSWLTLADNGDGTATLSGTPANSDAGTADVTLHVADALGRGEDRSFTITVSDVSGPAVPVISTPAQFASTTDTIHVIGTAEADSTVTITGGASMVTGTATSGSYDIEVTLTQNAVNNLSVTATDTHGNTSSPATVAITHDTIAPTGTIAINGGASYTNTRDVILTISATDPSGVSEMKVYNGTSPGSATWDAFSTTKSWQIPTGDTPHAVNIRFRDAAGNENTASAANDSIILDTAAPVISLNGPTEQSIVYGELYVEAATADGGNTVVVASGSVGPGVGNYTVTYDATDAAGNPATQVSRIVHVTSAASVTTVSCPTSVVYSGSAQTPCTTTVTGAGGLNESISADYVDNIDVGTASVSAAYAGDANHTGSSNETTFGITRADATFDFSPYSVTYDGTEYTATGSAHGAQGETLDGLDLSGTAHTGAGDYSADVWTFTDSTGNYNNASGIIADLIAKADAVVSVTPYSVVYDGVEHLAAGSAQGVLSETLDGLDLQDTAHTDAGDYSSDMWVFTDSTGNYNSTSGTVADSITRATVMVIANPQTKDYGSSDPALTFVASNPAVITGTLSRAPGENMGDYAINQGTVVTDANHTIDFTGNILTIVLAATQVVPADDGGATVGADSPEVVVTDPDQALTLTVDSDVANPTVNFDSLITNGTGTLPQTTISSTIGAVAVAVEIPDNTVVTASDPSWTGVMMLPQTDTDTSGSTPAGFSVGSVNIEVGSPDFTLTFSQAVKITLTGVTGIVGYRPAGSTEWQRITTMCNSATDHSNISAPGECYFQEGGNTVIWTYHFTTFGGLTPLAPTISPSGAVFHGSVDVTITPPTGMTAHYTTNGTTPTCDSTPYTGTLTLNQSTTLSAVSCDGDNPSAVATATFSPAAGGGPSGGSIIAAIPAAPATPAVPTVSPATAATPAAPATPAQGRGRVLGAEAYNFTKALSVGVRGTEVTELQKVLISEGLLKIDAPTGYFGTLTRAAVVAFQKARGIAQAGVVGPLTRAELNKGLAATKIPEQATGPKISAAQADSIIAVLQSFGADQATIDSVRAALK